MVYHPADIQPVTFQVITSYGTRQVFDSKQALLSITGIGMPPITNRAVETPYKDGDTLMDYSLEPRVLQMVFHVRDPWGRRTWRTDHRPGTRQRLLEIFNPILQPYTFRLDFNNGESYQLQNVRFDNGFETGIDGAGRPHTQRIGVRVVAGDPLWWGAQREVAFDLSECGQLHPTENFGDYWSWPEIWLEGPLANPSVYLVTPATEATKNFDIPTSCFYELYGGVGGEDPYYSHAFIGIDGTIEDGEYVYIKTYPEGRRAVDQDGNNVALSAYTSFSQFVLAPHPVRYLHMMQDDPDWYNNMIYIDADSYGGSATVIYSDRWIGL